MEKKIRIFEFQFFKSEYITCPQRKIIYTKQQKFFLGFMNRKCRRYLIEHSHEKQEILFTKNCSFVRTKSNKNPKSRKRISIKNIVFSSKNQLTKQLDEKSETILLLHERVAALEQDVVGQFIGSVFELF